MNALLRAAAVVLMGLSGIACNDQAPRPSMETPGDSSGGVSFREEEPQDTTLAGFWKEFRRAALADDTASLARWVQFPLPVRGDLDSSPTRSVEAADFGAVWTLLVAEDPGVSPYSETMREMIGRTPAPPEPHTDSADTVYFGSFVFAKTQVGWRWSKAFATDGALFWSALPPEDR